MTSLDWDALGLDVVEAELARRFPWKLPPSRAAAARRIFKDARKAWDCYRAGAAGALFDVADFFDACRIAAPADVRSERDRLSELALRGKGATRGQGARTPLAAHDAALRQRLRFHVVDHVLCEAQRYEEERATARRERFGADWQAEHETWPEVSERVQRACELAKAELGETMTQWRGIYDDFREVARHAERAETWPGLFYLPTLATCERLGLEAGLRLIQGQWAFQDGPIWSVA